MDEKGRIELGGRAFVPVGESTMEHDLRFMGLIAKAGIDKIVQTKDEPTDAFARRILDTLLASGEMLPVLGCLMMPEEIVPTGQLPGDVWTPAIGEKTERFVGQLKGDDKEVVRALVLSILLSFFERGIVSLWSSRTSSIETVPSGVNGEDLRRTTAGMSPEELQAVKETTDRFKKWAGSGATETGRN